MNINSHYVTGNYEDELALAMALSQQETEPKQKPELPTANNSETSAALQQETEIARKEKAELELTLAESLRLQQAKQQQAPADAPVLNDASGKDPKAEKESPAAVDESRLASEKSGKDEASVPLKAKITVDELQKLAANQEFLEQTHSELYIDAKETYSTRYATGIALKHKPLNRYDDILPFEETRVGKDIPDFYLNGNVIKAPSGQKHILTQGPLPNTITHFWQGILHEGSNTVVSLVMPQERGRNKCAPYWTLDQVVTADGWTITKKPDTNDEKIDSLGNEAIVKRLFIAKHTDGKCREITHYHYENWPDYGTVNMGLFHRLLDEVNHVAAGNPITWHCSAGVGRAGTCAVSYELCRNPDLDCVEQANHFRKGRNDAVLQTPEQLGMVFAAKARALALKMAQTAPAENSSSSSAPENSSSSCTAGNSSSNSTAA